MATTKKTTTIVKSKETKNSENLAVTDFNYDQRIATLTEEEKAHYGQLAQKIDRADITSIQTYGSELSSVIANNGDRLLASVRADSTNEVVEMTTELLGQLNMIDLDQLNDTKWKRLCRRVPMLRRFANQVQNVFNEYDTVANNVKKISEKIATAKVTALADNSTLQDIFEKNIEYVSQLRELILAAKVKLEELNAEFLQMQQDPSVESYELNDMSNFINSLEKRIADMNEEVYILTQNQFQIRATQHNNNSIAEKSDTIVNNILPVWKSQLALAVIMNNQRASVEAQTAISNTTNEMLRKNAEALKMNSINVARESERQVVDIETLSNVTQNLIETINEVQRIHEEGAQQRKAIEANLQSYADQLNKAILNK